MGRGSEREKENEVGVRKPHQVQTLNLSGPTVVVELVSLIKVQNLDSGLNEQKVESADLISCN